MAEKKKLSTADILAAARRTDGKSGSAPAPAAAAESEAPAEPAAVEAAAREAAAEAPAKPAAAKPAAKPATAPGQRPSVSDILALARANKAAAPAAAPAEKPAPKPKPAAEKPAVAAAPKAAKPAAPAAAGARPIDTSSILAAARTPARAGPLSKAEAAARAQAAEAAAKPAEPKPAARVVVPPKPAAAQPKSGKSAAAEEDRRWFVAVMLGSSLGIGFAALASTAGMWGLALARFMFPNITTEPPSKFKVGPPSDFARGVVSEKFKAQFGVWVVNTEYQGQSQIVALKTVCTHLGCTPNWLEGEQKFKCPCHGSGFYKDGINFEGPAPRPLERYAIRKADDGQLEVDKSRVFFEEMGQWSDPACFVPA